MQMRVADGTQPALFCSVRVRTSAGVATKDDSETSNALTLSAAGEVAYSDRRRARIVPSGVNGVTATRLTPGTATLVSRPTPPIAIWSGAMPTANAPTRPAVGAAAYRNRPEGLKTTPS